MEYIKFKIKTSTPVDWIVILFVGFIFSSTFIGFENVHAAQMNRNSTRDDLNWIACIASHCVKSNEIKWNVFIQMRCSNWSTNEMHDQIMNFCWNVPVNWPFVNRVIKCHIVRCIFFGRNYDVFNIGIFQGK